MAEQDVDADERRARFGRDHPHYVGPDRRAGPRRAADEETIEKLNNAAKIGETVRKLLILAITALVAIGSVAIAANEAYKNAMEVPAILIKQQATDQSVRELQGVVNSLRTEVNALRGELGNYVTEAEKDRDEYRAVSKEILRRLPLPPETR